MADPILKAIQSYTTLNTIDGTELFMVKRGTAMHFLPWSLISSLVTPLELNATTNLQTTWTHADLQHCTILAGWIGPQPLLSGSYLHNAPAQEFKLTGGGVPEGDKVLLLILKNTQ